MTATTGTSRTKKVYRYYKCASKVRVGDAKCRGVSVPLDRLDAAMIDAILHQVLAPDRIAALMHSILEVHETQNSSIAQCLDQLQSENEDAEATLTRLHRSIGTGLLDPEDPTLAHEIARLTGLRDHSMEAMGRIYAQSQLAAEISPRRLSSFADLLRTKLEVGEQSFRKRYLRVLLDAIVVHSDRAELVGRDAELLEAAALNANDNSEADLVRSNVPKWCTREDSNL